MGTYQEYRHLARVGSNNPRDRNRNLCCLKIAEALGVSESARYLHSWVDLLRAVRTQYTARSWLRSVRTTTLGAIRPQLRDLGDKYYLILVPGHVLLLGSAGQILVDTAPGEGDQREVQKLYGLS
jgi:hypothetical protein